jgi:hypothetical protein
MYMGLMSNNPSIQSTFWWQRQPLMTRMLWLPPQLRQGSWSPLNGLEWHSKTGGRWICFNIIALCPLCGKQKQRFFPGVAERSGNELIIRLKQVRLLPPGLCFFKEFFMHKVKGYIVQRGPRYDYQYIQVPQEMNVDSSTVTIKREKLTNDRSQAYIFNDRDKANIAGLVGEALLDDDIDLLDDNIDLLDDNIDLLADYSIYSVNA